MAASTPTPTDAEKGGADAALPHEGAPSQRSLDTTLEFKEIERAPAWSDWLWGRKADVSEEMLLQFYDNLRVTFASVHLDGSEPGEVRTYYKRVQSILKASTTNQISWRAAYEAEKILAHLRPSASLETELIKQIAFLREFDPNDAEKYEAQFQMHYPTRPPSPQTAGADDQPEEGKKDDK